MLNESFRLAAGATRDTLGVVWTAHAANAVSFVYVNGRLEAEAFAPGRAERSIDVPWHGGDDRPPGAARVVEIHDFDPGAAPEEIQPAITVPPELFTLPVLRFSTVPDAARYRIYHRPAGGMETRIAELDAGNFNGPWAEYACSDALDARALAGRWHFFRVETVTAFGIESRRESWAWFAADTSSPPRAAIEQGSAPGLYSIRF